MDPTIYVDLRCLQDPKYRVRGIGQHVAALMRARAQNRYFSKWKAVGLVDPNSPKLIQDDAALFNEVSSSLNPCHGAAPVVFIDGTPMTHDFRFDLRFQSHPAFFSAAVVYDFIPMEWPGYLSTTPSRVDYMAKMARLRNFDLFLPISNYTAWGLSEWLGTPRGRMSVTGASVRRSIYELTESFNGAASAPSHQEPYFLIVIAFDPRKNPDVAVKAVRHLNLLYGGQVGLKVVGHYEEFNKQHILSLAGHQEGRGFVEFCPAISDEELVSLYRGAIATIVSSHVEGFSLPVVEAAVCGCPVIASTCAAHMELIDHPEALFQSDDVALLVKRLEAILHDSSLRASLLASQSHLRTQFHEEEVGRRFWTAMETQFKTRRSAAAVTRYKRPQLAFLSPYPPDQSGVANYTAMTLAANANLFDSDLYSDAQRPLTFEGSFRDAGRVSRAPLITGGYDAIISVLGNSDFHTGIFEVFERYGGPCILHDALLTHIYIHRMGHERFLQFAATLLGRPVSREEVESWLRDRNPPSLLLEAVVERASPLIVHTKTQQLEIKKRHGVDAHVTTCCPTVFFRDEELTPAVKKAIREQYGISKSAFLISSFGIVAPEKGMETAVVALELLRSWNIPAQLHFVGNANLHGDQVRRLATYYGVAEHVRAEKQFVSDTLYRDFLIASDAAVQLRTYGFGQLSAALTDCISAGLPCAANSDLAKSCGSPDYVSTVPDQFSPLQVAENLAAIWERGTTRTPQHDARSTYLETHNFEYYGKRLIEILGIA